MTGIPPSLDELTSEWLTGALMRGGHIVRETVTLTGIEKIGGESGFASEVGRIHLAFDQLPHKLPSSMIAKMHAIGGDIDRERMLQDKYSREAAFYSTIWPDVGCRTPVCYYVDHQPDPPRFILLLEDLSAARFGDAAVGWSCIDAASVVEALASLHARWWNDPRLDAWDWLPYFGDATDQLEKFVRRRSAFLERYGGELSSDLQDLTMRIGAQHAQLILRLGGLPRTLLHTDTHLDNIAFVEADGVELPVVLDWQGVGKGLGVVDLSSFLLGGSTEERRACEQELIASYHANLVAAGVNGYPFETLPTDYSNAIFRWWVGTVNGLGSSHAATWSGRQAELALQSVQRWNSVAEDHGLSHVVRSNG